MDPVTRLTLISKLKDLQDTAAWGEFVEIYQPLVLRFCISKGLQHADAIDLTQEVLSRVSSAIEKYDCGRPGVSFRGWLYRITRNLVVDYFRFKGRHFFVQPSQSLDQLVQWQPEEEESAEFQREFRKQVFAEAVKIVRAKVNDRTWAVFWKTEFEGMSVAEAASEVGMTTGAVYVARSRVVSKLKSEADSLLKKMTQEDGPAEKKEARSS